MIITRKAVRPFKTYLSTFATNLHLYSAFSVLALYVYDLCPTVSELRFYGCCYPFLYKFVSLTIVNEKKCIFTNPSINDFKQGRLRLMVAKC